MKLIPLTGLFCVRQIVFRAYAGRGYQGDIAIDDIIILPHPCIDLVTETSCDFELGPDACGFTNSAKNEVHWDWYDAIYGKGFPLISKSVGRLFVHQPINVLFTTKRKTKTGKEREKGGK